jgi:hypothetical protein
MAVIALIPIDALAFARTICHDAALPTMLRLIGPAPADKTRLYESKARHRDAPITVQIKSRRVMTAYQSGH